MQPMPLMFEIAGIRGLWNLRLDDALSKHGQEGVKQGLEAI